MRLGSSVWCIRSDRNGRPISRRFSREVGLATTVKRTADPPGPGGQAGAPSAAYPWHAVGDGTVWRPGGAHVHIVIMGCGRVGSTLAHTLEARGHAVAVVDQDADAFRRLGSEFTGLTVTGIGFDRDVLITAGIEHADAFAAVSSGDNSNIISARPARETFGVAQGGGRNHDPKPAGVDERRGIPTVAAVRWTAGRMVRHLVPDGNQEVWRDPTGSVGVVENPYHPGWVSRPGR